MKILVVSYCLSPYRGSEPATGWGWAHGLSELHDVTVIAHPLHRGEVEQWLREHPESRLRVHWLIPKYETDPKKTPGIVRTVHYLRWLKLAAKTAREMLSRDRFDFIQFVSYSSISFPVSLGDLGIPFILGPVGGGQILDRRYEKFIGPMTFDQKLRNARVRSLPFRPGVRRMVRQAAKVLVVNRETEQLVRDAGGRNCGYFCDTGIREDLIAAAPAAKPDHTGLRLLWVGRMLYRKGLPLIFHALKRIDRTDVTLDVVGSGPLEPDWKRMVSELGLNSRVKFHGRVPFEEVFGFYDDADVLAFPSVNDSFGSQALEALARGLPVLCLNHQGVGTLLPDDAAWKVSVADPETTVRELAGAIESLAATPQKRFRMAEAAIRYARTETWRERVRRMTALYEQISAANQVNVPAHRPEHATVS